MPRLNSVNTLYKTIVLLTILLDYVLSWCNEICEALKLLTCHCPISPPLKCQILLKVGIQMLFQGEVTNKSHATNAAVKLDALEHLVLGCFARSIDNTGQSIREVVLTV